MGGGQWGNLVRSGHDGTHLVCERTSAPYRFGGSRSLAVELRAPGRPTGQPRGWGEWEGCLGAQLNTAFRDLFS